jgi:UPF0716 protein FxsA
MLRLAVGLLLISVPFLEVLLLIRIGQSIGLWATLALVFGTGLAGVWIISRQSLAVVTKALEAASEGRPPVGPVLEGLFLMLAGILLVTPGLMTDAAALLLLIPPLRRSIAAWSVRRLMRSGHLHVDMRGIEDWPSDSPGQSRRPPPASGPVIDGEFERVDEPRPDPPPHAPRRLR